MNNSRLQAILAAVPVATAGLYLLGFAYRQGYLDTYGIGESLFPLAIDRALLLGFITTVNMGLVPMFYSIGAIGALFFTVMVTALISSAPRVKKLQARFIAKVRSWRGKDEVSPTMTTLVDQSSALYSYVTGAFLIFFMLALITVLAEKSGKEYAQQMVEEFREQKGNWVMLYTPRLTTPTKAMQILCGDTYCAFWLGSESLVLRHESIDRMVMHNPALEELLHDNAAKPVTP